MPHLLPERARAAGQEFRETFLAQPDKSVRLPVWQAKEMLKEYSLQFVGKGEECIVFYHTTPQKRNTMRFWQKMEAQPNVLVSLKYKMRDTPTASKEIYYVHRILTALFPRNFPRIYGTFTTPPADNQLSLSGAFREEKRQAAFWKTTRYPLSVATATLRELTVPIEGIDFFPGNYHLAPDGGMYYLDLLSVTHKHSPKVEPWEPAEWDTEKLLAHMRKQQYSSTDILTVMKSILRLQFLSTQRVRELNRPVAE